MEEIIKNSCENCGFYLQHYIRTPHGYTPTRGHCICDKYYTSSRNKCTGRYVCEYWKPMEIQTADRKEKLINNLKRLAKELEAVCEVLFDESD